VRALVTGAGGFVGKYLSRHLREQGHDVVRAGRADDADCDLTLELSDDGSVQAAVAQAHPDVVLHLAAQTFLPEAAQRPIETYETNILWTARLLGALAAPARLLFVSSAQVYGTTDSSAALTEQTPLRPVEPYAASKAAGEHLCMAAYHTFGRDCVIARAFNHIGPGQDPRFAIPSFARQLAQIAAGSESPVLEVGNLESERDFLDVRDVVRAYALLAERGRAGEAYNVCSGIPRKLKDLLRTLIVQAHVPVEVREDPARLRPSEVPRIFGDNAKLRALGWEPHIDLEQSLRDIYESSRAAIATAGAHTR
jgi:GDP-4-dehydro-6-deoxy-D-mannose reductase